MADVPRKTAFPRKSAFSCEACRKRKVGTDRANPEIDVTMCQWAEADLLTGQVQRS